MNQKKAKFNIVDIIVILILVAGIAFVGVRMFGGQGSGSAADPAGAKTYLVTFQADSVRADVADTLLKGSKVENTDRNMDLGKLMDFTIADAIVYTTDSKGNLIRTTKEGYVSVTLVCELTGLEEATGLRVGKNLLNVGSGMGVCFGFTEIYTTVVNIDAK